MVMMVVVLTPSLSRRNDDGLRCRRGWLKESRHRGERWWRRWWWTAPLVAHGSIATIRCKTRSLPTRTATRLLQKEEKKEKETFIRSTSRLVCRLANPIDKVKLQNDKRESTPHAEKEMEFQSCKTRTAPTIPHTHSRRTGRGEDSCGFYRSFLLFFVPYNSRKLKLKVNKIDLAVCLCLSASNKFPTSHRFALSLRLFIHKCINKSQGAMRVLCACHKNDERKRNYQTQKHFWEKREREMKPIFKEGRTCRSFCSPKLDSTLNELKRVRRVRQEKKRTQTG